MMNIKKVTEEEAIEIIDTREPIGLFYQIENDINGTFFVGIDNSSGDANVEEFETKEECFAWLKQEEYYGDINKTDIYMGALAKWGSVPQIVMVFEEMAELQKELSKNLRGKDNRYDIAEEIADVEIMLEQMKILYNAENLVESNKKYKLKRLADRVGEIRKCRVCGCTDFKACEGGCYWVEDNLCSKCAEVKKDELHEDSNN